MTVITEAGEKADTYTFAETVDEAGAATDRLLIPLAIASSLETIAEPFGLFVQNDTPVGEILPFLERVDLVAIAFPAFSDGRGFSLAKRLRRAGFGGTLRARGPLIADQFADALACGFDEVEIPDTMANRQPSQQWLEMRKTQSEHYQTGFGDGLSIFEKRRAARAEPA